jgi:hypothetical protein
LCIRDASESPALRCSRDLADQPSNNKDTRKKVSALAVHAAKRTEALITNGAGIPLSPERAQDLDQFERYVSAHHVRRRILTIRPNSTLELIRRYIESVPKRGNKPSKFTLPALTFRPESARLKAQLDRVYHSLVRLSSRKYSHHYSRLGASSDFKGAK